MAIPAAKVKSLCTESEAALVRASRKGELELLSHAEVKELAARARKLVGKWRDLKRGQSRTRSREAGFGAADANTQLKKQIFRDALDSLEARLEQLAGKPAAMAAKPAPKQTKKHRAAEHRATRAAVRKGMVAVQDLVNGELGSEPPAAKAPAAKPSAAKAPAAKAAIPKPATKPAVAAKSTTAKSTAAARRPAKAPAPKGPQRPVATIDPAKQRKALTAAKTSRVVRSGKTTRVLSHVKSRGKRVQARRDARN